MLNYKICYDQKKPSVLIEHCTLKSPKRIDTHNDGVFVVYISANGYVDAVREGFSVIGKMILEEADDDDAR